MDKKSTLKTHRAIRTRFRAIVRVVMLNRTLLIENEDQRISNNAKINIAILTRREKEGGALSVEEKSIFRIPSYHRTVNERKKLISLVVNLKCLKDIPPKVKARISSHLEYMYIKAGRVIIKEGTSPVYVYIILSGEAIATQSYYDPVKEKTIVEEKYIVTAGDILGQIAFVENNKRTFTYTAIKDIEALSLSEDPVREHLLPVTKLAWEQKQLALSKFDYFNNWTLSQISFFCQFGQIKQYEPMETIYYRDKGVLNWVYFIISGECMVLQCLKMFAKKVSKHKTYKLCNLDNDEALDIQERRPTYELLQQLQTRTKSSSLLNNQSDEKKKSDEKIIVDDEEIENHFIDVASLSHGAIFGLGEHMTHRAVMARTMVQCLLIPRFWLLEKRQNPGNLWQRMAFYLNSAIPSREALFEDFLNTKNWQKLKKKFIFETLDTSKIGNPTKIEDIPVICRVVESNYEDE